MFAFGRSLQFWADVNYMHSKTQNIKVKALRRELVGFQGHPNEGFYQGRCFHPTATTNPSHSFIFFTNESASNTW